MRPVLGNRDIVELTDLRRDLHRAPEISGEEKKTAARILAELERLAPDRILTGLGGYGVAAIYDSGVPGPTVLFRCELDALPIQETGAPAHKSEVAGKGHLCGHDGHMSVLVGLGRWVSRNRPRQGRIVLMFQPAEEDGSGAAAVIADPKFDELAPDYAFAIHNFPGLPLGAGIVETGVANCASRGMRIRLNGRTAHASQPETGASPSPALAELIPTLAGMGAGGNVSDPHFRLVTITHASMGAPAFGIAPGNCELWVTLRTQRDEAMDDLVRQAESAVQASASRYGLSAGISYHDIFAHCENDTEAVQILKTAARDAGIQEAQLELPMRASEDFGRFGHGAKAAMLLLGAGEDCPALHNPDYDFPDDLIAIGVNLFSNVATRLTG